MREEYDLVCLLEEAQEKILEAMSLLSMVYSKTKNEVARVYIIDHLRILCDNNHDFLTKSMSIEDWKNSLLE
jgi:hypothetical protein